MQNKITFLNNQHYLPLFKTNVQGIALIKIMNSVTIFEKKNAVHNKVTTLITCVICLQQLGLQNYNFVSILMSEDICNHCMLVFIVAKGNNIFLSHRSYSL